MLEEPRPNGNAFRDALEGVERSSSLDEEREPFREGLEGTRASFGGASLEARRGVKEWERECVCDEVCCSGDKLLGADPEADKTLRLGGEEERFWVTKGKSTFRCLLLDGGVVGVMVLLLSLRFDLYLEILLWSSVSKGASEGDFDLSGPEMLDRSSADFDHALRDIDRRSPMALFDGVKDLDDDGVVGREGMGSNAPCLGRERSKTDLGDRVSAESKCNDEKSGWERVIVEQTSPTVRI